MIGTHNRAWVPFHGISGETVFISSNKDGSSIGTLLPDSLMVLSESALATLVLSVTVSCVAEFELVAHQRRDSENFGAAVGQF